MNSVRSTKDTFAQALTRVVAASLLVSIATLGCGPKPGDVPQAPKTDPTKTDPTSTPREPIERRDSGTYFI